MARAITADPFQPFRFHLLELPAEDGGAQYLEKAAGITQLTLPELTLEGGEYKTGLDFTKKKLPGPKTVGDVTFSKIIFKGQSRLLDWFNTIVQGGISYRRDLIVFHYHLSDVFDINTTPSRIYKLKEAFISSIKPYPDFDPNTADAALEEVTLMVEDIEVLAGSAASNLIGV